MKRKFFIFIFLFALVANIFSTGCLDDNSNVKIEYRLNADGTGYIAHKFESKSVERITVPDTYGDLPVTEIGSYAFKDCVSLLSVSLGKNVQIIEGGAFYHCTALKEINFPEGLKKIGSSAFIGCKITAAVLPESLEEIGIYAFSECAVLTSVTFKNADGWTVNGKELSPNEILNTSNAALLLTKTYRVERWLRE